MRLILALSIMVMACGDVDSGPPDGECEKIWWYADCDSDGIAGVNAEYKLSCPDMAPAGQPACGGGWVDTKPTAELADCDDMNAAVHPGATEVCDMVDNDCD